MISDPKILRSPPPIAKNQKFRRRNRYFGEAPAHECPIILYQENDSEGYESQKFSAARADAYAYRSRRSAPRNTHSRRELSAQKSLKIFSTLESPFTLQPRTIRMRAARFFRRPLSKFQNAAAGSQNAGSRILTVRGQIDAGTTTAPSLHARCISSRRRRKICARWAHRTP